MTAYLTHPILQAVVQEDRYWLHSVAGGRGIGWRVGPSACSVSSGETAPSCSSGRRSVSAKLLSACCDQRSTHDSVGPRDAPT